MAKQERPQLNIEGITTSASEGASLIPQYIGLTIPVPPNKIYLTEENKQKILLTILLACRSTLTVTDDIFLNIILFLHEQEIRHLIYMWIFEVSCLNSSTESIFQNA
jgi:hypothetical protein